MVRRQAREGKNRARRVLAIEKELFSLYRDPDLMEKPAQLSQRGGAFYSEAAVSLMQAIHSGAATSMVLNTRNRGAIPDLPAEAVIETNCLISGQEIRPLSPGPLPVELRAWSASKAYEQLTVEAAIKARGVGVLACSTVPSFRERKAGPCSTRF